MIRLIGLSLAAVAAGCVKLPSDAETATTATLVVEAATTGADPDADGYTAVLDGTWSQPVATDGSVVFDGLSLTDHSIELTGVAPQCTVSGANPRSVTVLTATTTSERFDVSCLAAASIVVTSVTTGDTLDADGYVVTLDGMNGQALAANGSLTFPDVAPGAHSVELGDRAANCTLTGPNPRPVDVAAESVTQVGFELQCVAARLGVIAYSQGPRNDSRIMLVDVAGGPPQALTAAGARNRIPAFTPDGTTLLFETDRDGNSEIYSMSHDGSNLVNLTSHPADDADHAISPDGTKIAFISDRDGNSEIYSMNVDGSDLRRLTTNSFDDDDPTWSGDGSRIAFRSDRVGNNEIYVMDADGSNLVRVTNTPADEDDPVFSPDGSRIAFVSDRDHGAGEIYTMRPDGSDVRRLTVNNDLDSHPAWSWDGTMIAFASDRDGDLEIYAMNGDGSGIVRLTNNPGRDDDPDWAPGR